MIKTIPLFLLVILFIGLFQSRGSYAYTVDEEVMTKTESETEGEAAFAPKLPLADLVKPLDLLNAPSALESEEIVFPDHGEIIIDEKRNTLLGSEISPASL